MKKTPSKQMEQKRTSVEQMNIIRVELDSQIHVWLPCIIIKKNKQTNQQETKQNTHNLITFC